MYGIHEVGAVVAGTAVVADVVAGAGSAAISAAAGSGGTAVSSNSLAELPNRRPIKKLHDRKIRQ